MDMNGTWKLVSADNVSMICDVLGIKDEFKKKAVAMMSPEGGVTQSIDVTGDNVSIVYNIPGKTIECKTKLGQPADMPFFDGRILTCEFSIDGDKLVEKQSGAFDSVNIREMKGKQLIITMTSKDVTTTRVYEKV
ncbi:calycin superfamily [Mactra antiquata]